MTHGDISENDIYIARTNPHYFDPHTSYFKKDDEFLTKVIKFSKDFYNDDSYIPMMAKRFTKGAYYGMLAWLSNFVLNGNKNSYLISKLMHAINRRSTKFFPGMKYYYNEVTKMTFFGGVCGLGYYFWVDLIIPRFELRGPFYYILGPGIYGGTVASCYFGPNAFVIGMAIGTGFSLVSDHLKFTPSRNVLLGKSIPLKHDLNDEELAYLEAREKIHQLGFKYIRETYQDKKFDYVKEFK